MLAALIFVFTGWRMRSLITIVLLVGYYLLACYVPAPDSGGADIFSAQGSFVGWVDRQFLPGKIYYGNIDPEGILGTIPAIATALLGMFTGQWVKLERQWLTPRRKVIGMVVAGIVLLVLGLLWNPYFPINKKLWTSSFVLVVGAYSLLMFALFYYLIDVLEWRKWSFFFTVIGMNSITIYLGQKFIRFGYTSEKLFGGAISYLPEQTQPFFEQAGYITVCWLFLYILYRNRIFLKI